MDAINIDITNIIGEYVFIPDVKCLRCMNKCDCNSLFNYDEMIIFLILGFKKCAKNKPKCSECTLNAKVFKYYKSTLIKYMCFEHAFYNIPSYYCYNCLTLETKYNIRRCLLSILPHTYDHWQNAPYCEKH